LKADNSSIAVALAGEIGGDVKVFFDLRAGLVCGLVAGIVIGLFKLLKRR